MNKKVLIFHTSIGLGHKTIAENIGYHLEREGYTVQLSDILEVQSGKLVEVATKIHEFINTKLPFVWSWLYSITNVEPFTRSLRVSLAGRNSDRAKKKIDEFQPDLIISTHTTSSGIVSYLKKSGQYKGLFAITFSDFHLHRYWLYSEADFYLANIEEQKQKMVKLGIEAEKIFVCGITLKPKPTIDENKVKQGLGLSLAHQNIVLFGSGSLGTQVTPQSINNFINNLIEVYPKEIESPKVIVVCGKNEKLKKDLDKIVNPKYALVLGFYKPMQELYAISDIFVTKPGGLSTSEALQWFLPLCVTHLLPGQEELNFDYLTAKSLIMSKVTLEQAASRVSEELLSHNFRKNLIQNPNTAVITGLENPGNRVISAVNSMFHNRLTDHQ